MKGNIFQSISLSRPKKSAFNLSHARKFSFDPGRAVPTLAQEVLPSDQWSYDCNALLRFQPLLSPIMHLVDMYNYTFFVPNRLNMGSGLFEIFITGGVNGDGLDDNGDFVAPPHVTMYVVTPGIVNTFGMDNVGLPGMLLDYLGVSNSLTGASNTTPQFLSMFPVLSYWRIWCEYFRDPNLHPDYVTLYPGIFRSRGNIGAAITAAIADPDNPFDFWNVPKVCWEKDYFRSALPFAQRGSPVETPLTGTADLTYKPVSSVLQSASGLPPDAAGSLTVNGVSDPLIVPDTITPQTGRIENIDEVTLTTGGFTINALRLAARLQEWMERMARGGYRYIEQMMSHFGVRSSDARLQRSEYLAGGKIPVHISEVLQTSQSGSTPLAEMAGHGVAAGKVAGFNKFFEEHGMLISISFVRPRTGYQQGTPRMFTQRLNKLDYAWPTFANLGEQEVLNSEIYWNGDVTDNTTFGYQQRYAEYKYIPSTVHGDFKTSLNFWHWGDIFATRPTLSPEFVECSPDPRIFNVLQDDQKMYCIINNQITAVRPLPYYGEPTL